MAAVLSGMYDRILIPTDGSEATDEAVEHALDLAKTFDAAINVLYAVEVGMVPDDVAAGTLVENLTAAGERVVADVRDHAETAGVRDVETTVEVGAPHRSILDTAEDWDADLVVMGTHGRTGLDRYLLGSVTEKVVRSSDVPVLTVRHPRE